MHSATYSPEDNKLRLYPACRLSPDDYQRIKAAGFAWAPRQELFVAPMWTPEREDLLMEMCGEIGDEDTSLSLVERAEAKAERLEELSERRADEAEQARAAVDRIADGIPFGQPILVGHHSERHARKDAERIENGMRRAVDCWKAAQYWQERAQGAIRLAKYKERPDVRARRIKGLEADKHREERTQADARMFLKLWENEAAAVQRTDGTETTFLQRAKWITNRDHVSMCFPIAEYPRPEGASQYEGSMSLWSALGGSDEVSIITPEEARDIAVSCHTRTIAHTQRWIDHLANRITYERAMLDEVGGTVAERTGPEKGGAVRCWCSPGHGRGWSYIIKVNEVSVSVLDNWGNGGANFSRTIPFTDLKAVMTAAQVQEARADGRLTESENKQGFYLSDSTPEPLRTPEPPSKNRAKLEEMQDALRAGVQVVAVAQLFPTPPALAARMVEIAAINPDHRVLEPSAGTGNLLRAIGDQPDTVAVEINPQLIRSLALSGPGLHVVEGDFLEQDGNLGTFDRVVMNPPFANGADLQHIQHALTFLKPGGRLVALCANGPRQRETLKPLAETSGGWWEDLPAGTFADQGTNISTALVVIEGKAVPPAQDSDKKQLALFDRRPE